jgi:predicted phage-related endonuclease
MLTEAQRLAREGKLTASRVACLMTGEKPKIMQLWRELCGDPGFVEEDLDDVWAVQLGSCTENLNLDWYTRKTGHVLTRRGEVVLHPDYDWAAATLDGFDAVIPGPVETKHVSGFEKFDVVLQRYQPQIHWQMEVTQTTKCAFSVIEGGRQPRVEIIDYNKDYADELMARALRFMEHVWNMTEPVVMEPVTIERISAQKDYNFIGNNQWAVAASDWLNHRNAAKLHDDAEAKLRELIPNDARTVTGYDVIAKRDRANRVSIRSVHDEKPKRK